MFRKTKTIKRENRRLMIENEDLRAEVTILREENRKDPLTGIGNRLMYDEAINEASRRFVTEGVDYAVVMLDLNGLKGINDENGHKAGDALIIATANTLQGGKRDDDIVCRFGGDEFVIILPDTDMNGANAAMQEHIRNLGRAKVVNSEGKEVVDGISASFGIASVLMKDDNGRYVIDEQTRNRTLFLTGNRRHRGGGAQQTAEGREIDPQIAEVIDQSARYITSKLVEVADARMYSHKKEAALLHVRRG
ncbi:GGDEF domain-containing protein [Candidatus Marsarchaeota archaeon]|nr:GGDEF domain-containing protein [Candidatus Marsarchaeota archaeon]